MSSVNSSEFMAELDEILDRVGDSQPKRPASNSVVNSLKPLVKLKKPAVFEKGESFLRFVKSFSEYVSLCDISEITRIDLYMLQYIKCETTHNRLQAVVLSYAEQTDIEKLIKRYIKELYPIEVARINRTELLSLKQKSGENVEDFCFRITDLANKSAYELDQTKQENSIQTLVTGASCIRVRERLMERGAKIKTFSEARNIAIQTEHIQATLQKENVIERSTSTEQNTTGKYIHVYSVDDKDNNYAQNTGNVIQDDKSDAFSFNTQCDPYREINSKNYNSNSGSYQTDERSDFGKNRSRKYQPSLIDCWNCGENHRRKFCPLLYENRQNENRQNENRQNSRFINSQSDSRFIGGKPSCRSSNSGARAVIPDASGEEGGKCNKIGIGQCILVRGTCKGREADFFVDTGSSVSIVAKSFIKFIGLDSKITACQLNLTSFSGNNIKIEGQIKLPITLAGLSIEHDFVVAEFYDAQILLGMDMMAERGICIDPKNKVIFTDQGSTKFRVPPKPLKRCMKIVNHTQVTIPPMSSTHIAGRIIKSHRKNANGDICGQMEPYLNTTMNTGLIMANSLVNSEDGIIPIRVINLTG